MFIIKTFKSTYYFNIFYILKLSNENRKIFINIMLSICAINLYISVGIFENVFRGENELI